MRFQRVSFRLGAAILLFVAGLFLMIRLILMQSATINPSVGYPATVVATVAPDSSAAPARIGGADVSATHRPLLPFPTAVLTRSVLPDIGVASAQPTDTVIPVTVVPTSEPPTLVAVSIASPTALPIPTTPATATSLATAPTLTPTITSIPTRTPRPTWAVPPRLIRNEIDPPWWPCQSGQIKAIPKLKRYYPPDHAGYARTFVDVLCFDTEQAARADGYTRAP